MQCNKCNSKWESSVVQSNCPFCKHELELSSENNLRETVNKIAPKLYLNSGDFLPIISENFSGEIRRLLEIIVKFNGACEIYNLKNINTNDYIQEYQRVLETISKATFIKKDVLNPAVEILCSGLGLDSAPVENINNNIEISLTKYNGNGCDVVIPNSVTSIGRYAFSGCSKIAVATENRLKE